MMYVETKNMILRDIKIRKCGASEDLIMVIERMVDRAQNFRDMSKQHQDKEHKKILYQRSLNSLGEIITMISFWQRSKLLTSDGFGEIL